MDKTEQDLKDKFYYGSEWKTIGGWRAIIVQLGYLLSDPDSSYLVIHKPIDENPYGVWHKFDGTVREDNGSLVGKNEKNHSLTEQWVF